MSLSETTSTALFVCPFCEQMFDRPQSVCDSCDSTVVVPIESQSVYDSILSMCR